MRDMLIKSKVPTYGDKILKINRSVNCNTFNCVYMIECDKDKCKKIYIGQTGRLLKFRIAEHRGYISNQVVSVCRTAPDTPGLLKSLYGNQIYFETNIL